LIVDIISDMSDKVIVTRIANALIDDAELSSVPIPHKSTVTRVLGAFKQTHGGLWVGGRVTLTESAVEFSANSINRSVTKGQLDVRIPLTEITSVTVEFGVVTKIIAIESPAMTFKVRCYGAEKLAEQIKAAIPSTGT
jgi:hypothetical protein